MKKITLILVGFIWSFQMHGMWGWMSTFSWPSTSTDCSKTSSSIDSRLDYQKHVEQATNFVDTVLPVQSNNWWSVHEWIVKPAQREVAIPIIANVTFSAEAAVPQNFSQAGLGLAGAYVGSKIFTDEKSNVGWKIAVPAAAGLGAVSVWRIWNHNDCRLHHITHKKLNEIKTAHDETNARIDSQAEFILQQAKLAEERYQEERAAREAQFIKNNELQSSIRDTNQTVQRTEHTVNILTEKVASNHEAVMNQIDQNNQQQDLIAKEISKLNKEFAALNVRLKTNGQTYDEVQKISEDLVAWTKKQDAVRNADRKQIGDKLDSLENRSINIEKQVNTVVSSVSMVLQNGAGGGRSAIQDFEPFQSRYQILDLESKKKVKNR